MAILTVIALVAALILILAGFVLVCRAYVTNPVYSMFFGQAQLKVLFDSLAWVLAALASILSGD